jgi:hypothetical protein
MKLWWRMTTTETKNNKSIYLNRSVISIWRLLDCFLQASNGRSCVSHNVCGEFVSVGDINRFVRTAVTVKGILEPAVKLVKIADGVNVCVVAFVPRLQNNFGKVDCNNINKFCIIKELYSESNNSYKRGLSSENMGRAGVVLLDSIPINK